MEKKTRFALVSSLSLLLVLLALPAGAQAQSQSYEPFRVDVGLSGAMANDIGAYGGGGVVEPKFNLHDFVAVGGRIEGLAFLGGNFGLDGGEDVSVKQQLTAATLLKGEAFLTRGKVRPFVGFGLGLYVIGGQSFSSSDSSVNVNQEAGRHFGVAPQVGIDLGRVRLAGTYNAILGSDLVVRQSVAVGGEPVEQNLSRNYFSFELSFRIGGRKRQGPPPSLTASR